MIQANPQVDRFKQQLQEALQQEAVQCRPATVTKHAHVYTCGDHDETVYFIESGQIKLLMHAPEGRECLLTIHTAGDIFGELCLSGLDERQETATAMQTTVVRLIPCPLPWILKSVQYWTDSQPEWVYPQKLGNSVHRCCPRIVP